MSQKSAIVIGAGIVGLATARSLAARGFAVTVFERNEKAVGASIRNFGMIWPVGQPDGVLYNRAINTKQIWKQVCTEAKLWYSEKGSLHLCYEPLEWQVANEFVEANMGTRPVSLLTPKQSAEKSEAVNETNLLGGLYSGDEIVVESRIAIETIPFYLQEKYGVKFYFNTAVTQVQHPTVIAGGKRYSADLVYVCSGADFETLYPEVFLSTPITKCKLQMMRLAAQPGDWQIGPSLCGGLSLSHYKSFEAAASLKQLKDLYKETMPDYVKWGIHVMVSQNGNSELTIGDSHEYGLVFDPFDRDFVNQKIIDYLKVFAQFKNWQLLQSWNGIYAKRTDGGTELVQEVEPGVTIINATSGAGMTLSFGLAEEVIGKL